MKTVIRELRKLNKSIETDRQLMEVAQTLIDKYTIKQIQSIWYHLRDTNYKAELNTISTALMLYDRKHKTINGYSI